MALDGVSLGLALLAELNKAMKSMQLRNSCYKEAPVLFSEVDNTLTRIKGVADQIAHILLANPEAVPQELIPAFVDTANQVKETLLRADNAISKYCSRAFVGSSSSGGVRSVVNKGLRLFKAKSLTPIMKDMQSETSDAENQLQHLLSQLVVAVKSDEKQNKIESSMVFQSDSLRRAVSENSSPYENFLSAANAPKITSGARDPCGPISVAIFMANAAPGVHPSERDVEAARATLELCSGQPITLCVAGAAISLLIRSGLGFEEACRQYFDKVSDEMTLYPAASFLDNAIRLSLTALAAECEKTGGGILKTTEYSVSALYASLCVLENQQFAPLPVLSRMWNVPDATAEDICKMFSSMSLAKMSTRTVDGTERRGLHIHDLHLAYCRRIAAQSGVEREWHRRLLEGHMPRNDSIDDFDGPLGLMPA